MQFLPSYLYSKIIDAASQIHFYKQYREVGTTKYHYLFFYFGLHLIHASFWEDIRDQKIDLDYAAIYQRNDRITFDGFFEKDFYPALYLIEEEPCSAVHFSKEKSIGEVAEDRVIDFCSGFDIYQVLIVNFGELNMEHKRINI